MSFQSLDRLLHVVTNHPGWEAHQQFQHLQQAWIEVVEPKIACHTRPLHISRQVLWIATSSSVWAQTLAMKRYGILQKLNAKLSVPLIDLRFSTAKWHQKQFSSSTTPTSAHPSLVEHTPNSALPKGKDPQTAFQRWANLLQQQSQNLPACPQCHCPTPPGELQRWQVCAYCAARQWQT